MSRNDSIFTEITGHGNWNRVAEYHSKASLINAVLTLGLGYFFLSGISCECVFKLGVGDEAWADLMNMFPFKSLLL